MPKLTIDNQPVDVPEGTTILDAAASIGIAIPTLCFLKGMAPQTSCFVCVVKVNGKENLLPSCATAVAEGMAVESQTPEVLTARRTALELLMSDHLGDCQAPCQSICPARMDIPVMLRQIADGQVDAALQTARDRLVLPATLGRICPAPCEKGCRRAAHDQALAIKLSHRFAADTCGIAANLPRCKPASGKSVAIVGAGPAGLATAWHLLQMGHACTIFDDHDAPGGALRYAVPENLLPRDILDAEIAPLRKMGATFRLGVRIGRDVTLEQLRKDFIAVVLAVGETKPDQAQALGVKAAAGGIEADRATLQTSLPGVFSGGDAVRKQKMAVRSVGDGAALAASVDQFITGQKLTGPVKAFSCHIGQPKEGEMALFLVGANPEPRQSVEHEASASVTGKTTAPPAPGLTAEQAKREAPRCLHCDCRRSHDCRLRDACQDYSVSTSRFKGERRTFEQELTHAKIIYEPGKCIACGLCIATAAREGETLGLTFVGRGFPVRMRVPFGGTLRDALQKSAEACVKACPTGALALRDEGRTPIL